MSVLYDYFLEEYQREANELLNSTNDENKFINETLRHGKKYAINYQLSLTFLDDIKRYITLVPLFEEYFHLVPNDIAIQVIDLYNSYSYEEKFNSDDIDKYITFRRIPLIVLFFFANAYGNYNRLDKYIPLSLSTSQQYIKDMSIDYQVTQEDEEYVFHNEADIIFHFNKICKTYKTDASFIIECIKLLNPTYDEKINRIKKVHSYTLRDNWMKKAFKAKFNSEQPFKPKIDLLIEKFKLLNRSKFR